MRNFFLTILFLLLTSCVNKGYVLKKRYIGGYRIMNSKAKNYAHKNELKNKKEVCGSQEKNENISALNLNNSPINLDHKNIIVFVNNDLKKNKIQVNYSYNSKHHIKQTTISSNQFKSTGIIKKHEPDKNYSKQIPLAPESGAFFYVWGIFGSIFLAIFLATLYFLIISGVILITYNPNLFLLFMTLFIVAAVIIGILYLLNAD